MAHLLYVGWKFAWMPSHEHVSNEDVTFHTVCGDKFAPRALEEYFTGFKNSKGI
jgi:hypothetical protein